MFEGQPKGLFALALANTGERFGYYTMLAVFALFLRANYGLSPAMAGTIYSSFLMLVYIYSSFLMLVYFLPLIGGIMADKFGFGKMVTTGIIIMFAGYLLLSVPLGGDSFALVVMLAALLLIGFGTGLFKGNLQVMVGETIRSIRTSAMPASPSSIWPSTSVRCLHRRRPSELRSMLRRQWAIPATTPITSRLPWPVPR